MDNLNPLEFKQLEALLSGKKLTTGEQIKALTILRDNFPDFLSNPILNLTEANRKDNTFLIKFFRDSFNRNKIKAAARQIISKSLSTAQELELEKSLASPVAPIEASKPAAEQSGVTEATPTEQVPPPGAATSTAGGGLPGMGMPTVPNVSARQPRIIHIVQQTPPPTAMEGGTGKGLAATSKIDRLEAERVGAATAKINRLETGKATVAEVKSTEVSRPSTPPTSRFNFNSLKGFKIPTSLKTLGSNAQMFASKNLVRIGNGLWNMGKIGTGGAYNLGTGTANRFLDAYTGISRSGPIAGSRSIVGKLGRFGRGRGWGGISRFEKAAQKRGFLLFLLGILAVLGLTGILGFSGANQPGTTTGGIPTGTGCPDTSTNKNGFSCRYLNPSINISDTNISQTATDNYIKNYSSIFIKAGKGDLEEFKKRVNYIVEKSKQGKLNPAVFLGYWKTESLFSTIGTRDMGCVGNGFYEQVQCALGIETFSDPAKNPIANCARSDSADSPACQSLKSVRTQFDKTHPINYPIRTFDDFTEAYGPYDHLTEGQPTNCISTYNKLIETAKELNACQTTTAVIPPGPVPTEKLAQIVYWAQVINNNLQQGLPATSWNKMIADISNNGYSAHKRYARNRTGGNENGIYWCTDIVIDAYNLAGLAGLSLNHEGVRTMQSFWQNTQGYYYMPYNQIANSLKNAKAGFTLFRVHPNNYELDHASVISYIDVDYRGNGEIRTLDSNAAKSWSSPITDGNATDRSFLAPIVGVGGIVQ